MSGLGLILSAMSVYAWKDLGNPRKNRIVGFDFRYKSEVSRPSPLFPHYIYLNIIFINQASPNDNTDCPFYHYNGLHPPGHPVTASVLRDTIKGTPVYKLTFYLNRLSQ